MSILLSMIFASAIRINNIMLNSFIRLHSSKIFAVAACGCERVHHALTTLD